MSDTYEKLTKYSIRPAKGLGQNFLINQDIVKMIIDSSELGESDFVIEVGPGLGALTGELAKRAGRVVAVEIDSKLIEPLEELKLTFKNLVIVNGNILKLDIEKDIIRGFNIDGLKKIKVISNLPYYITTPVIMKFLEERIADLVSMIFMVQEEVGKRMTANPGGKDYGALSVVVGYFSEARKLFTVPPSSFTPRPGVDSCVVKLDIYKNPKIFVKSEDY
ncbi:MAG: 16S rRNA (adenine(1518)-N(6)/adenine(1519)-N(6))-dimethyltransferase RsmA, partial [Clostridiales bacterium]|nr:16S rRNA (adenine(1518)-N(6)/adenine(1519)-N(6))-dimethyltransferase RsmA [Clostridiales bacterium]